MDVLTPYPWQYTFWDSWQKNPTGPAYLLTGISGIGKRHLAQCMAMALLGTGIHPDYRMIAEGAGIDEVRSVLDMVEQTAKNDKVIVVALVESLSVQAQQALLKTLEEPPGKTVWLLVSSNSALLLPTLLSRCQSIRLMAPSKKQAMAWLTEHLPGFTSEQYEQALVLAQGGVLKVKDWLQDEAVWQGWRASLLNVHSGSCIVTQETLPRFLTVWQLLIVDLLYKQSPSPIILGQWLEKLQYWQQQQTKTYVNASWLSKMLYHEWCLFTVTVQAMTLS